MRSLLGLILVLCAAPGWCDEIVAVLQRSQDARLLSLTTEQPSADRARIVQASFDALVAKLRLEVKPELRVIHANVVAETLNGHVVVANESLADLSESHRLFVLAHELGHVALGHWSQMGLLYKKHVPGEVVQSETDPVAGVLGREASGLAHRQEFEADAYGLAAVRAMGYSFDDVRALFVHMGMQRDTPTHPSSSKRIAHLRSIE